MHICHRNICNSWLRESSRIPLTCCIPAHHKELLWKQPETLLSPRLESNPIWEDLPCYLAERQDSNGIISYDMLMPASDLYFFFLVSFFNLRLPEFFRNLGLIEHLIEISAVYGDLDFHFFRLMQLIYVSFQKDLNYSQQMVDSKCTVCKNTWKVYMWRENCIMFACQ